MHQPAVPEFFLKDVVFGNAHILSKSLLVNNIFFNV